MGTNCGVKYLRVCGHFHILVFLSPCNPNGNPVASVLIIGQGTLASFENLTMTSFESHIEVKFERVPFIYPTNRVLLDQPGRWNPPSRRLGLPVLPL